MTQRKACPWQHACWPPHSRAPSPEGTAQEGARRAACGDPQPLPAGDPQEGWDGERAGGCAPHGPEGAPTQHSRRPQSAPRKPAGQRQVPVAASQDPPLRHPHSCSQPDPKRPGGHPAGGGASCRAEGWVHLLPHSPRPSPVPHPRGHGAGGPGSTHVAGSRCRGSRPRTHRRPRPGRRPGSRRDTGTSARSSPRRCRVGRLGRGRGVSAAQPRSGCSPRAAPPRGTHGLSSLHSGTAGSVAYPAHSRAR